MADEQMTRCIGVISAPSGDPMPCPWRGDCVRYARKCDLSRAWILPRVDAAGCYDRVTALGQPKDNPRYS
jgi:hypothetical protein